MTEAQQVREVVRALVALSKAIERLAKYEHDFKNGKEWVGNKLGGERVVARTWDAIADAQERAEKAMAPWAPNARPRRRTPR